MTKHVFAIITPAPAAEDAEAYDDWYVNRHIPDVLAVPGFTGAQRYRLAGDPATGAPGDFLTIYEMDCEDRGAVMAEVRRRAGTELMPMFRGAQVQGEPRSFLGEAVTDWIAAPARD